MQGLAYLAKFTMDNLYGGYVTNGKWDETKYNQYMLARAILPGYSAYADYEIGKQKNQWYMERYGMSWSDIMSPWNLPGYGQMQGGVNSAVNYISKNVEKLYK